MPNTVEGRKLLAHELTHVVQQANNGQDLSIVRRKLTTLGGEWEVEKFDYLNDPNMRGDAREIGVDMWLQFIPKPPVDATKIALVQIGRFILNGKPYFLEDKIREKRATPEGWAIDQQAKIKDPNYAASGHGIDGEHYIDAVGKPHQKNAKLHDYPHLGGHGPDSSQYFEIVALATEGKQAGTSYGSVYWGWERTKEDKFLPFQPIVLTAGLPTKNFLLAAELWNRSKWVETRRDKETGKMITDSGDVIKLPSMHAVKMNVNAPMDDVKYALAQPDYATAYQIINRQWISFCCQCLIRLSRSWN